METIVNKKENSIIEIEVNAEVVAWQAAVESEWKKAGEDFEIKGFRKGQAPIEMVKKNVNPFDVLSKAADTMLNEMYVNAVQANDIWPVAQPALDIKAMTEDELKVLFTITVKPEFELGNYKGLTAVKEAAIVEDEEIQQQIDAMLEQNKTLEVVERAIAEGDTAVIDFEGFKDGVAFEGGKGEGYPLEVGSNTFIPGFEEQLVGKAANDELDVEVTFPEEYQAEDLAGKPVVFKVKVIEVKEAKETELNDEFVVGLGIEGVTTVAEMKEDLAAKILEQKQQQAEMDYTNDLVNQVIEATKIDVPKAMIDQELDNMYQQFMQRLQMQGMNEEMFLQMTQQTAEQVREQMEGDAINKLKYTLVLEKIAETEKVEVSDAEVEEEIVKLSEVYNMPVEQIKQMIPDQSGIMFEIKMQKAADIIKSNVK
ncbi:trigger factor [Mycoplasma sp. P36-A1]|uniref:trigger factor n=1 Tax=Mycoplasma sp. P36-A1 TaxID=3252900 RepID=UPI003C2B3C92